MPASVVDCDVPHNQADTILTLAIIFGIIVSYLPQHLKIIKLRSSSGISPWFLLMGGLSAMANLFNVLVLQAPYIKCCFKGSCWENLLGLGQMFVQWAMFQLIFLLYYWNFPEEAKEPSTTDDTSYTLNDSPVSRDWWLSVQVSRAIRLWAALLMSGLGWLVFWSGLPSTGGNIFAWFLGIISAFLSMLQYLPQIYRTYQTKDSGAISIGAMCMQTPGSFIFCYTLAVSPGVNASTWLTYLIGGFLQGTLLTFCIYYRYWEPHREYILIDREE